MTGARGDGVGGHRHHLIDETCRLVKIGMEMCGGYASRPGTSVGFIKRTPLTSVDKLHLYCRLAAGHRGVELARRAARLLVDGSLSPMETALKMLLADPRLYGSMGLRGALLNCPIEVDAGTLGKTRQRAYRCDLLWPDARVALEYDSDDNHASVTALHTDAMRRLVMDAIGIDVITVTSNMVKDLGQFRAFARQLAAKLGRRVPPPSDEFLARQESLHRMLLG